MKWLLATTAAFSLAAAAPAFAANSNVNPNQPLSNHQLNKLESMGPQRTSPLRIPETTGSNAMQNSSGQQWNGQYENDRNGENYENGRNGQHDAQYENNNAPYQNGRMGRNHSRYSHGQMSENGGRYQNGQMGQNPQYQNDQMGQNNANGATQQQEQQYRRAMTQRKVRQALQQAGFKNIRVLGASYLIQAKDNNGNTVYMAISPPQTTVGNGSATTGSGNGFGTMNNNGANNGSYGNFNNGNYNRPDMNRNFGPTNYGPNGSYENRQNSHYGNGYDNHQQ
ncbi:MAG TPA: hypothetical protein VE224_08740 [Pseudolabrys sp.]|nr:hypothetical protein [Pseudolabrys sp.]